MRLNDLNFGRLVLCRSLSISISKGEAFEPGTNRFCSTHQHPFSQRIQSLRRSLPGQQERAFILLLGSVTDNDLCPTDLSRKPARHRSMPSGARQQALPQRPKWSGQTFYIGRCQRTSGLENLCRLRSQLDSGSTATIQRHRAWNGPRRHLVCTRFDNNRSLLVSLSMGSVPKSQICNQTPHFDGDSKLNTSVYRSNHRPRTRYQFTRCDHSRTWLIHSDGPRLFGLRTLVSSSARARFLCHSRQRQPSIQTPLFVYTRPEERSQERSNDSVDWSKKLLVVLGRTSTRQLSCRGHRSKVRFPYKQLRRSRSNNRGSLQTSLANRTIFQMDQTTSKNQEVLRYLGQQCEDPSLDRSIGLRSRSDHQKATRYQARHLHNF